jgi:hypothetical protein
MYMFTAAAIVDIMEDQFFEYEDFDHRLPNRVRYYEDLHRETAICRNECRWMQLVKRLLRWWLRQ